MQYRGSGRCSAVFSFSEEVENLPKEEKEAIKKVVGPTESLNHLALRISKTITYECPICIEALKDFIGFKYEIKLTNILKKSCISAYPSLMEHCKNSVHAHIIPDFAINPINLLDNKEEKEWITLEIKPKGIWKYPKIIGMIIDNIEYYINPVKLYQCRFSLMKLLKNERNNNNNIKTNILNSSYCPNQILIGDKTSISEALKNLYHEPFNNFKFIHGDKFSNNIIEIISTALKNSDVLSILSKLQLYGKINHNINTPEWEVLDIELLYLWSKANDPLNVKWIICDLNSSLSINSIKCSCQKKVKNNKFKNIKNYLNKNNLKYFTIPSPMTLEECIDCFYVSTTAKDISILISLSTNFKEETTISTRKITKKTQIINMMQEENEFSVELKQWQSPHGGVIMEFGFPISSLCRIGIVDVDSKRHKSLNYYFSLDKEVLEAWERWEEGI